MKILVAEDNAINRKLATRLLEKHGHTVVIAENGRAALDALARESVDAVLMDVQMPVMDGFEAIRTIRASERRSGTHLPIIALTAHAMKGDRERCLEAGADDYLTKPIRTGALLTALDHMASLSSGSLAHISSTAEAAPCLWDFPAALARMEGDRELLEEITGLFADEAVRALAEMRQAVQANDAPLLERLAHTLKGSSANISATSVCQASLALEMHARAKNMTKAREQIETLQAELARLLPELEAWSGKISHAL